MIVALTSGQKLGLAGVAALFIAFALVSSFVLFARDRDFPGRRLPWFIAVTAALFVAMIAAVVTLAVEDEEAGHAAEPAATETDGTETEAPTETTGGTEGDAAAGEQVFASAGCGGCHTLEEAGSSGTVGPSLDQTQLSVQQIAQQVEQGGGGMPSFGDQLSDEQIRDVSAFVAESAGSG
jgi:mono/diheme cytochrome c family protein